MAKNISGKPHVVVIPLPMQGHFPPMIHLATKLAELGSAVTIVNFLCVHEQLKAWKFPPGLDIRLEPLHPNMDMSRGVIAAASEDLKGFFVCIYMVQFEFRGLLQKLMEQETPVSCIVSDHYIGSWPLTIASEFGIPLAVYWPGTASWLSLEYHIELLDSRGEISGSGDDHPITYIPGIQSVNKSELPMHFVPVNIPSLVAGVEKLKNSSFILCNTLYEMEPTAVDTMKSMFGSSKLLPVAPLFPVGEQDDSGLVSLLSFIKEDRACLDWLDKQELTSVLYISFGSIATLSQEQFEELAGALESSRLNFLLIIRSELIDALSQEFYSKFLEMTRNRSMIISWAPQREVLKHPAVAGFLTHAGWNSIMEGVCRGIPLICFPCVYEQVLNSKIVEESKAGVRLKRDSGGIVSRQEFERAFAAVSESSEMKTTAGSMSKAAVTSVSISGNSHASLRFFIDAIRPGLC